MKIIWRRRTVKVVCLLCFIGIVPYILLVSLEKTENRFERGKHLFIELRPNGSGNFRYEALAVDKLSMHGGAKGQPIRQEGLRPHDLPMMVKYCNTPSKIDGEEGKPPEGYYLKLVHVFIRHGDRTSIHDIHGYDPGEYSCKFDTWYNGTDPKISQFVPTVTKFMGKQPGKSHFLNWAMYPNKDKCDNSDLTSLGAYQHIRNGQFFQQRYINSSGLFDDKLALSSQLYVRSTEVSRTYQSSVAFLYGFTPDLSAQYLNIDNSRSLFFCSQRSTQENNCFCKHGKDLSHYAKKFKKEFSANRTSYITIKRTLADIFDSTVEQLPWLSGALDALAPALCHKSRTPCSVWNHEKCVTSTLISDMWDEAIATDLAQTSDPNQYYLRYSSVMLHPIMVEITRRMKDVIEGRQRKRFVLYSGHDLTLSPLLIVLGLYDGVWPPLASRFVIELYERKTSLFNINQTRYFLKFIYNGKDRTSDVSFCIGKTVEGLCDFDLFSEFVFRTMLQRFKYTSYSDACSRIKIQIT